MAQPVQAKHVTSSHAISKPVPQPPHYNIISAKGWNSCSKGWYRTSGKFINYCPFCHHYNTLIWNPKHTSEGEWTCKHCDADFCICGKCKARGSGVYLRKA